METTPTTTEATTTSSPTPTTTTSWRNKKDEITEKELSECDREKLHMIGHIQGNSGNVLFISFPAGKILACDARIRAIPWVRQRGTPTRKRRGSHSSHSDTSVTVSCSMSVSTAGTGDPVAEEELETKSRELIGSYLQYYVPYKLYLEIFDAVENMKTSKSSRTFHFFKHKDASYAITLFTTSRDCSTIGIEIETVDGKEATSDFYSTLVSLGRIMEFYVDEKIVKTACDTIFKLLNVYDRGMVYQFNDDSSGEIVHEIKKRDVTSSYVGMRFPASDIPKNSRDLYIKNGLRYIHDVDSNDVPILDVNSSTSEVDLSHCRMRAVAKPHIAYLRNMGVKSSMSIAIVVENQLWGLLAFHGYKKAFKPSLHQRIACETVRYREQCRPRTCLW